MDGNETEICKLLVKCFQVEGRGHILPGIQQTRIPTPFHVAAFTWLYDTETWMETTRCKLAGCEYGMKCIMASQIENESTTGVHRVGIQGLTLTCWLSVGTE